MNKVWKAYKWSKSKARVQYETLTSNINALRMQPHSLLKHGRNRYSQLGDDGIIEYIFGRLGITKGFFVEFGGWDGIHLSNTRSLFENGWQGVFIEADDAKFRQLKENYKDCPNIMCIKEFVTFDEHDPRGMTFDAIAQKYFPDREITLLSIDVDGMDYRIFESVRRRAVLVIVEGGHLWNPRFKDIVPDEISEHNLQQPMHVMFQLGKNKGYEPIAFNLNTYFIDRKFFPYFSDNRNDPLSLWKDYWLHLDFYARIGIVETRNNTHAIRKMEGRQFSNFSFEYLLHQWLNHPSSCPFPRQQ